MSLGEEHGFDIGPQSWGYEDSGSLSAFAEPVSLGDIGKYPMVPPASESLPDVGKPDPRGQGARGKRVRALPRFVVTHQVER